MRILFAALTNLFLALFALLGWPGRLLRARSRPKWVRLRLVGGLPYRPRARRRLLPRTRGSEGDVGSVEELRRALDTLAKDVRVRGVLLHLEDIEISPAKRSAIASHLAAFRATGKRVVAYVVRAGNAEVELLCAADEVVVSPAGRLELMGFSAEATALAEGLQRLGVRAHFVRRGAYKTAPELFTHADISDIQRKTVEGLLDERYQDLVQVLAHGRRLTLDEARSRIDRGPYSARRAKTAGLVDTLCSEADLPEHLAGPDAKPGKQGEPPRARVGSLKEHRAALPLPQVRWRPFRPRPVVAVVPLSGAIVHGEGGGGMGLGPKLAGSEPLVRALRRMEHNPRVAGVVLFVDSPGGSALASELVLEATRRLAKKKPVVAYVDRVAASGGYMAAMGARELWSAPDAVVGSIGVFAGKFEASELLSRLGIRRAVITRGENAGLFSTSRAFTDSERSALELEVEETYQAFLSIVAEGRKRSVEEIHARAEGRVYSGRGALDAGLVDRLGGFEDACKRTLALAGVPVAPYDVAWARVTGRQAALQRLLQSAARAQVYALDWPLWRFSHLGPPEPHD
ncbi:MAG: signal peptide peptidase SppA [Myxococcaceae bacterium]|nr:signal peptide peptidase SppA [Myxococcaceae bacterium]